MSVDMKECSISYGIERGMVEPHQSYGICLQGIEVLGSPLHSINDWSFNQYTDNIQFMLILNTPTHVHVYMYRYMCIYIKTNGLV